MRHCREFLAGIESEKFQAPGRFIPRSAALLADGGSRSAPGKPEDLTALLTKDIPDNQERWFRCWSVAVRAGDGMTWTAEGVRLALLEARPTFRCFCISQRSSVDQLPQIATILGDKTFLRIAARKHIASSFLTLHSWLGPLIVAACVFLTFAAKLLEVAWKTKSPQNPGQGAPSLIDSTYLLVGGAMTVAGLLAQWTTTRLTTRTISKSMESFLAGLPAKQQTAEYDDFIDALALELRGADFPRFVIVDNFDHLDFTTRKVIDRYFQRHSADAEGSELWVIFEPDGHREFTSLRAFYPEGYGYVRTRYARQVLLDVKQKQALVALIPLDQSAVEFETVKRVCEPLPTPAERDIARFQEYRLHHPRAEDRYSDLDFLYTLAITAAPPEVMLTDRFLRNNLSHNTGLCPALLQQILRNIRLQRLEFEQLIVSIRKNFDSALVTDVEGGLPRLRVSFETALALEQMADELRLAPPGLVHLFWAVFWHELLAQQPVEAVWIQKLANHVVKADVYSCSPETLAEAQDHLFEAAMFTLHGCFRSSILDPIVPLINRAAMLLDAMPDPEARRNSLAELCWGVYMILGDQRALSVFADVAQRVSKPTLVHTDRNEFVVAGLEPLLRDVLLTADDHVWSSSAAIQLRLRATWLALTLYRQLSRRDNPLLWGVVEGAAGELDEIQTAVRERLRQPSPAPLRAGESLNLCLALWCSALELRIPDLVENRPRLERFSNLTRFAADCMAAAKRPASAQRTNLTADGLARDLAATAAASLIMGARFLQQARVLDECPRDVTAAVVSVFSASATALGYDLAPLTGMADVLSPQTATRVGEWMNLCGTMWHAFGMSQMWHFTMVRRAHFAALSSHTSAEKADFDPESGEIDADDFVGLIANCVASDSLLAARELSAFYLRRAAAVAAGERFGKALQLEFAQLAIRQGHHLDFDLRPYVQQILDARDSRGGLLATLAEALPDELASYALMYLNASYNSVPLTNAVTSAVRAELERRGNGAEFNDARAVLEWSEARSAVGRQELLDVETKLHVWQAYSRSWLYPVLLRLLYRSAGSERIRSLAASVLNHNALDDASDGHLLLAAALAPGFAGPKDPGAAVVIRYLQGGIKRWEEEVTAETNLQVYEELFRLDPANRTLYLPKRAHWLRIKTHRDHLRWFPQLVEQGNYFLIYSAYVRSYHPWNLDIDMNIQDLRAQLGAQPAQRQAAIKEWKENGARTPHAIARRKQHEFVAAGFLILGSYLFEPPLGELQSLAEERAKFNAEAMRSLQTLLRMIIELPDLPSAIKDLLRRHSNRLYAYSLPPDRPEKPSASAMAS